PDTGIITCAHSISTIESDDPRVLESPVKIFIQKADQSLAPFGVVRKVWFCGRKGWDYCFVEPLWGEVDYGVIDFERGLTVPIFGLVCNLWNQSPFMYVGAIVTRYGYQMPYRTIGYIVKYCAWGEFVTLKDSEDGREIRFTSVFLVQSSTSLHAFSQSGDSG